MSWRPGADLGLLLASLAAVIAIRLNLLNGTDFPINDGALFLAFIEAIVPVFPALPATVEFSGLSIPFAYPPLSFWLAAGAVRLGADPLVLVHQAPILMNIGYVLLFAGLLLRTGHSQLFTALAVFVFGTTFLSYEWLVMGGGLSRGLGSLCLMGTLLVLMPPTGVPARPWTLVRLLLGGLCVGVALLSHLEWGMLAAVSALLCCLLARQDRATSSRAVAVIGATAALVVLPWFWSIFQSHGVEPFLAAARTGSLQRLDAAPGGAWKVAWSFNVLVPFVVLGALVAARTRDVFWLLFLVAALVLTPRGGRTPMLLALGVFAATGLLTCAGVWRRWAAVRPSGLPTGVALLAVAGLLAVRTVPALQPDQRFVVLPREVRDAMAWVAARHPGGRFAVLNDLPWYYNASAEWFPVLARAINTTTVQGREWLPNHDFRRAELAVHALNGSTTCDQLLRSLAAFGPADFIWTEAVDLRARGGRQSAAKGGRSDGLRGPGTAAGCLEGGAYEEVHANGRVRIFRVPAGDVRLSQGPSSGGK